MCNPCYLHLWQFPNLSSNANGRRVWINSSISLNNTVEMSFSFSQYQFRKNIGVAFFYFEKTYSKSQKYGSGNCMFPAMVPNGCITILLRAVTRGVKFVTPLRSWSIDSFDTFRPILFSSNTIFHLDIAVTRRSFLNLLLYLEFVFFFNNFK